MPRFVLRELEAEVTRGWWVEEETEGPRSVASGRPPLGELALLHVSPPRRGRLRTARRHSEPLCRRSQTPLRRADLRQLPRTSATG